MKYGSDILEMLHEEATIDFKLGFISEADMRKYDELCLAPESQDNNAHESVKTKPDLVTA